jgi:kynurenine formamidase
MSKVIFLSHILDEKTPTYAGKSKIMLTRTREIRKGDTCNEMSWVFSNHVGTHVDAPRHFVDKAKTIDQFPAAGWLFNKVELLRLRKTKPGQMIVPKDLRPLCKDTELVLIKTGYERLRGCKAYWNNAPGLHPDLALWLKKICPKVRAVGMDIISVSSIQNRELGREAHHEFLSRGILLVEDMKLSVLKRSPQKVLVAPMRVKNSDAAPCCVFAWSYGCA